MPDEQTPVAFVDRYYEVEPEWLARTREWYGHVEPAEWSVYVEPPPNTDDPFEWFDDPEVAIAFARQYAPIVLVRLGSSENTIYSAGSTRANTVMDGSGRDYPEWPPDNWPDYRGPAHERRALDAEH